MLETPTSLAMTEGSEKYSERASGIQPVLPPGDRLLELVQLGAPLVRERALLAVEQVRERGAAAWGRQPLLRAGPPPENAI